MSDQVSSPEGDPAEGFERRFGGLRRLYGDAGAQRIFDAHVVVVGIGGVGSWVAEALARSGVGALTLIDMDHVAESNTNRQVHALTDTLGQAKVLAMRDRIAQINPAARVQAIDDFVAPDNWEALWQRAMGFGAVQGVVDACDQRAAKETMAAWALRTGIPFITVGAAGGKRLGHKVELGDLSAVTHDPLLAQLRYRLRKAHGARREGSIGIPCVFSRESVTMPEGACEVGTVPGSALNCHGYGSSVAVTATFGLCAAGWLQDRLASGAKKSKKICAASEKPKKDAII